MEKLKKSSAPECRYNQAVLTNPLEAIYGIPSTPPKPEAAVVIDNLPKSKVSQTKCKTTNVEKVAEKMASEKVKVEKEICDPRQPKLLTRLPATVAEVLIPCLSPADLMRLLRTCPEIEDPILYHLDTKKGRKHVEESTEWSKEDQMLKLLASMDPSTNARRADDTMTWLRLYFVANDISRELHAANTTVESLPEFTNFVKGAMKALFDRKSIENYDAYHFAGSLGPHAWNLIIGPNKDLNSTFYVYDQAITCNQFYQFRKDLGSAFYAACIRLPNQDLKPGVHHLTGQPWAYNFVLLVSEKGVVVSGCKPGSGQDVHEFPEYSWDKFDFRGKFYMDPIVGIFGNLIGVWSDPYTLTVLSLTRGPDGTSAGKPILTLVLELSNDTKLAFVKTKMFCEQRNWSDGNFVLGDMWAYFKELNHRPILRLVEDSDKKKMKAIIVYPAVDMKSPTAAKIQWNMEKEVPSCSICLFQLRHYCYTTAGEKFSRSADFMAPVESSTTSALFWNSVGFTISTNFRDWYWHTWKDTLPAGVSVYVTAVNFLDPEHVAFANGKYIFLATVDVGNMVEIGDGLVAEGFGCLTIFKNILVPDIAYPRVVTDIALDYDAFEPYLWVRSDNEKKSALQAKFYKVKFHHAATEAKED